MPATIVKRGIRRKGGIHCPCCGQHCEEYKFSLGATPIKSLWNLYERGTAHIQDFLVGRSGGHITAVLKHFDLISQVEGDGKKPFKRSGIWAITQKGIDWIQGRITIPEYVYTFDNKINRVSGQWTWKEAKESKWKPEDARQDTETT